MQYKLVVEKGWSAGRLDRIESWGSAFALLFWGIHQVLKLITVNSIASKKSWICFSLKEQQQSYEIHCLFWQFATCVGTLESHEKTELLEGKCMTWWYLGDRHNSSSRKKQANKMGPLSFLRVFQYKFTFSTLEMSIILPPNGQYFCWKISFLWYFPTSKGKQKSFDFV